MRAVWNGQVIAEADKDDLIYIERNWYFPPASVNFELLQKSDTPYTCPWKGVCKYYTVQVVADSNQEGAFSYP
jgi:uncharacterized protein (DUF427 family)